MLGKNDPRARRKSQDTGTGTGEISFDSTCHPFEGHLRYHSPFTSKKRWQRRRSFAGSLFVVAFSVFSFDSPHSLQYEEKCNPLQTRVGELQSAVMKNMRDNKSPEREPVMIDLTLCSSPPIPDPVVTFCFCYNSCPYVSFCIGCSFRHFWYHCSAPCNYSSPSSWFHFCSCCSF